MTRAKQQPLYEQYHFDEPWDGPNNQKLLDLMPRGYALGPPPAGQRDRTSLHAVVGHQTAWPAPTPRYLDEINDPPSVTALAVVSEQDPTPWTAPDGLSDNEVVARFTTAPRFPEGYWNTGFFWSTCYGRLILMSDGESELISPTNSEWMHQLIRVADNGPDDNHGLGPPREVVRRKWSVVHYGNLGRLIIFVVVALWPIGWLREAR